MIKKQHLFFGRLKKFFLLSLPVIVIGIFVSFVSGCATYNPATGRYDYLVFTTDSEVAIGNLMNLQVKSAHTLVQDEAKKDRFRRIAHQVTRVVDRQDLPYEFYLVKSDELNAFTIPGGFIYMYEGLFDKLNDDELAAVLAHELAHNAAKHTIKKFQGVLGYNLIAGAVISQVEDDTKKRIAALGANAIVSLAMNAYSREDELEADRLGVKYMYLAGYDPYAMISTFELLEKNSSKSNTPLFSRTHPHFDARIETVKNEIEAVKNKY